MVGKRNFLPIDNFLQPDVAFKGKADNSYILTGGFESDLDGLYQYGSLNELLLKNDAVIINDLLHANFLELKHIIRNCKHVFINSLFPLTSDELLLLHNLAEEAQVVVQMGFQHRFTELFTSIKEKNIVPRIVETSHFTKYKRRSTQLSIISDVLLEDLDLVLSTVNSDIKHVHATGVGVIYNDPDIINIRIEFQNACIANISGSKIAIKDIHKTRFYQNNSYYTVDHLNNSIKAFSSTDASFWENTDESDNLSGHIETFEKRDSNYIANTELDNFIHAVKTKKNSRASLYDHLAIKFVADKIYDQLERNFVVKCG